MMITVAVWLDKYTNGVGLLRTTENTSVLSTTESSTIARSTSSIQFAMGSLATQVYVWEKGSKSEKSVRKKNIRSLVIHTMATIQCTLCHMVSAPLFSSLLLPTPPHLTHIHMHLI